MTSAAVNTRPLPGSAQTRGVALAVVSACTYAVGPVLIKVALDTMSVWSLLVARLLAAAALLWIVALATRGLRGQPRDTAAWLGAIGLGAVLYGGQLAFFALALQHLSASMVTILFHTSPIVVVGVAVLSGRERISPVRALALALCVAGVAVVALGGGGVRVDVLGVALALGSAAACAGVVLFSDVLAERIAPLPFALLLISGAALGFAAVAPLLGVRAPSGGTEWILVLAIALVPGVIGTTAMLAGVGLIGPSLVSILLTLEPPVTVLLAWLALGERLTALQLAGGAVVLAAAAAARRASKEVPAARVEVPPA
jgi:drug/metabolite transporter (DMT)-like permease